ncbi:MAG TPA: RsmE family RNA methyltransferase [Candidatus Dormibacteraeota bacterium]|jgi:16S rRNA (uracil1498-N3)-methyltransferase|nr:RsmE family RNA methyltransferase [Candidatus Dormibacteraeota bacterium]
MPDRFFIDAEAASPAGVVLEGSLAKHLARSLRMRAGDSIVVVDPHGHEHGVVLRIVGADRVAGDIAWSRSATGEPRLRVTVLQALPRERMEDCVDVLVEAGAAEVRPVITERVVSRPSGDRLPHRVHRWQAVATESAQLAGRGTIPRVHAPVALADALAALAPDAQLLACTFDGERSIVDADVDLRRPLGLCIGPEGGFGERDLDTLRRAGADTVHLGARILRTRYAGAVACALLLARSGDLSEPLAAAPRP